MTPTEEDSIRPFEVTVQQAEIDDLRRRLDVARWPDQLPGVGWDYGTERSYLERLCEYWREDFDWTAFEERFNRFDQYLTTVDGQRLHFYHVRSTEPDARPLLLSHGWPGSVAEFLDVLGPLSNPAAHGGDPADAFHVIAPSLPGYGFSGLTEKQGYGVQKVTSAFADLMTRLGYDSYFAQGGDWGGLITAQLAATYPDRVDAIHSTRLFLGGGGPNWMMMMPPDRADPLDMLDEEGMAAYRETKRRRAGETGYQAIQATKPQTLGYALNDSPVGLAGWIIEKFRTWSDCEGDPDESFSRDRLLDNLSVYWLTETITSSMRLYYETDAEEAIPDSVDVPTGYTHYPAEFSNVPRAWAEEVYDVVYWQEMSEGGHFNAMEVPELFVEDLRNFFRGVR